MADSDSGIGCFCKKSCSCCKGSGCRCSRCKNRLFDFVKKKFIALTFVAFGWAGVITAFVLIEDPDWNIAVVPYFCTFVACALVTVTCKRGRYNDARLADVCRPPASRRTTVSEAFVEILDSKVSPLLSGPDRNDQVGNPDLRVDCSRIKDPEELFEPSTVISREQGALRRNSQVIVLADVHQPINELADVHQPVQEEPAPRSPVSPLAQSSSTASDPHNSTTPDSGVALQSTGQYTQSSSSGPIRRPSSPDPDATRISPQQDQQSPFRLDRF